MKLQWIGGPTFLLELGSFRVLADPVFGTGDAAFYLRTPRERASREESDRGTGLPVTRLTEFPTVNIDALDLVVVSRMRADHLDPTAIDQCMVAAIKDGTWKLYATELGWLDDEGKPKRARERMEFEVKAEALGIEIPWND